MMGVPRASKHPKRPPAVHRSQKLSRQRVSLVVEELEERLVPSFFPTTTSGISVFEDQLPSMDAALTQFMATHTVGTQKQTLAQVEALRAYNPNYTMLEYQLGTGNSPYDYIINDQWANDFSYVSEQDNGSWLAHQTYSSEPQSASDLASGLVGNSTGWEQADIANPAWQQYTIQQVLQNIAATGANGWFADSFTYGFGGAGYSGTIPTRFQGTNAINSADWPGGVTWNQLLGNWVNVIETAFSQYNAANGTDLKFIPNLDNLTTSWMPTSWYQNVDGAFLESFGDVGPGYDDPSTADWVLSMNRGLALSSANKIVIMQPYLDDSNPDSAAAIQQREYLLGTYLLLQGNYTYLNISEGGVEPYYFPEYQLNLGPAVTPVATNVSSYQTSGGLYRRDFQNGFVLVNPNDSTVGNLSLGGTYQQVTPSGGGVLTDADLDANGNYIGGSLSYQNVSSVTLAPGTAAIFLYPTSGSGPTVVTPATASSNPVAGVSVDLSVLGQENGSGTGLTYTWASTGPAAVTYSDNGDNTAQNTTATFTQAGSYTFTVTISDASNQSVTSSIIVTVDQTLSTIRVSPASATIADGVTKQFSATALDQFGNALASQPTFTWSVDAGGVGTITHGSVYSAPATGSGTATVQATSGSVSGTAAVTVTNATVTLSPTTLPGGTVGASYREVISATGGSGFTFQVTTGKLPPGLKLNSSTGVLSGKPSSPVGSPFAFTITATASSGASGSQRYSIAIASPLGTSRNAIYVENLYGLLLNRPADPGAQYWVNQLNLGLQPASVIQAIESGPEYLDDVVTGLYQSLLNRAPDSGGLAAWVGALQNGATIEQVTAAIAGSPEFFKDAGGTNADFLTALYRDILNRAPDSAGFTAWQNALAGGLSRSAVAAAFLGSEEYQRDLVSSYYQEFLGRNPDPEGWSAWVQAMQAGLTDQSVLAAILGSAEGIEDWS